MSDVPFVDTAREATETARGKAKGLLPWLPDPYVCDECSAYCEPTTEFVEAQAMPMPVWKCGDCGSRYHREESESLSFDMWG